MTKENLIREMKELLNNRVSNIVDESFIRILDEETTNKIAHIIIEWFDIDNIYLRDKNGAVASTKELFEGLKNIEAFIGLWLKPLLENNYIENDEKRKYLEKFIDQLTEEKDTDKSFVQSIPSSNKSYINRYIKLANPPQLVNISNPNKQIQDWLNQNGIGVSNQTFTRIDKEQQNQINELKQILQFLTNNAFAVFQLCSLLYKELSHAQKLGEEIKQSFMDLKTSKQSNRLNATLSFMSKTIDCASHYKKVYEQPEIQKFIKSAR